MTWSTILGWFIFWIGLISAIILYATKRKFYPILYLISISLYFFTLFYIMDVYDLSKNWIILMLAISAVVMIGIGFYLSKKFKS